MTTIGAYAAKTRLPELLRQVKKGKRFTITLRGQPIAELVPSGSAAADEIGAAVEEMLKFERVRDVADKNVAAWIAEGRR
ncbi:MAG TPA: type II toxin-antitoxin system prevent-host-death family antitoxin [Stellaceae bacterium]|jgi:prevent-host-death family protein|nr:type II toxin-antitoxin system prevent-host-death family antitoxin [Stellaceae bacterium]